MCPPQGCNRKMSWEESESVPPNAEKTFVLDLNLVIEEEGESSLVMPTIIATAAQKRGWNCFLHKMMMPINHSLKEKLKRQRNRFIWQGGKSLLQSTTNQSQTWALLRKSRASKNWSLHKMKNSKRSSFCELLYWIFCLFMYFWMMFICFIYLG